MECRKLSLGRGSRGDGLGLDTLGFDLEAGSAICLEAATALPVQQFGVLWGRVAISGSNRQARHRWLQRDWALSNQRAGSVGGRHSAPTCTSWWI